jgi:chloramphenicol-sensitive protein RarD
LHEQVKPQDPNSRRNGLIAGIASYAIWGAFPLFWPLLKPAGALEILSHRIIWSFVFVAALLVILRTPWGWLASVFTRTHLPRLSAAAVLIAANWLTYIWAVNAGHVVEASLGYFINPLVNVLLGVLVFGERLGRRGQIGGLLALVGVGTIAVGSWQTLWISLALAFSFGLYGAVKKASRLPALQGLVVESGFLAPLALGYVGFLALGGAGQFGTTVPATSLLMVAGIVTAVPLWLFAIAAPRLPFGVIGILQYLNPTAQFLLGILVFHEHVTPLYWVGLVLVWIGSCVFLSEALGRRR